jgi:hypothetical protein
MQSRHIVIALVAAVAAFALAFGIGKLTAGSSAAPSGGAVAKPPEAFDTSGAKIAANVPSAGLPALKPKPTPTPTPTPASTAGPSATATPFITPAPTAIQGGGQQNSTPPSSGGGGPTTGGGESH